MAGGVEYPNWFQRDQSNEPLRLLTPAIFWTPRRYWCRFVNFPRLSPSFVPDALVLASGRLSPVARTYIDRRGPAAVNFPP